MQINFPFGHLGFVSEQKTVVYEEIFAFRYANHRYKFGPV